MTDCNLGIYTREWQCFNTSKECFLIPAGSCFEQEIPENHLRKELSDSQ